VNGGSASKASPRILAAVELLAPQPGEALLEIGCGTSHAIQAVLERQPTVRVTAIDRSQKAVARAQVVNSAAIRAGRVHVFSGDIETAPVSPGGFDRAFAIRVNSFWTRPGLALPQVAGSLKPGGEFWIVYDSPADKITVPIMASLEKSDMRYLRSESRSGTFAIILKRH
jgi:SAM-dependent methyltransferase